VAGAPFRRPRGRSDVPLLHRLLSDPFRAVSLRLLEGLEADNWGITMAKWSIGEGSDRRPVGVFELTAPGVDP
jgi:hypothetical protein